MFKRFSSIIIMAFAVATLSAQRTYWYTTEDNISNNRFQTICEDKNGFIWIGTENGLNKYDGYEFVNWTDKAGNVISTEARYTGIVTEKEATYTANFASLTSVEAVSENKEECIYDLLGNRISHISKQGIYIVNGKKTLVK